MPYAIKDYAAGAAVLIETSAAYLNKIERKQDRGEMPGQFVLTRVSSQRAHRWVREGGTHETALYIDFNGRIRRASDGY